MKLTTTILVLSLFSCVPLQNNNKKPTNLPQDSVIRAQSNDTIHPNIEIIETFTDSLNIGKKENSKIELVKYRVFYDQYVIVKFFTKGPSGWYLQSKYLYECDASIDLQPDISDYNNDKFNDLTFVSATAARGANEVRRLFIYDDENKALTSILNAQDYPNMRYNPELNCIDAFLMHGGSTTVFARIVGDSLKQFASVDNSDFRVVNEIDESGNETLLRKDSITNPEDIYLRFKNYKPLKVDRH